jgi:hypothetical protein
MLAKDARKIARQWVLEEGHALPGFHSAFFHGSINGLSDDAPLPATSDIDIMIVLTSPDPPGKRGKFLYQGVLLEVSYLSLSQVQSADQVLGNYHLAGSFRTPGILSDPTGHLTQLQQSVSRDYAKRAWVRTRCEDAEKNVLGKIHSLNESAPFHEQVMAWLFGTGVTTHILLVAGLKNPTVRRRYVAVKELLEEYALPAFHETLLEMLGCAQMSRGQVEQHISGLAEAFDAAGAVLKTPCQFAADMSEAGRPVAIDGSRELIESGLHREAVFWMVAVYSRCQQVLCRDAPEKTQERFSRGYRHLLSDIGIDSFADLQRRGAEVKRLLPNIWDVAEVIMAANPNIEQEPGAVIPQRLRGKV